MNNAPFLNSKVDCIISLSVHLTSNVTAFGLGLNVHLTVSVPILLFTLPVSQEAARRKRYSLHAYFNDMMK